MLLETSVTVAVVVVACALVLLLAVIGLVRLMRRKEE